MSKKSTPKTFPSRLESQKHYSRPQPNDQDHKIKTKNKNLQVAAEEYGIVDILSEDTLWLKKTIRSKLDLKLKRLDLDLYLQTRSKVTRHKRRPMEPTKKTPSAAIVKREDGRSRSSLLLKFFLVDVRVFLKKWTTFRTHRKKKIYSQNINVIKKSHTS